MRIAFTLTWKKILALVAAGVLAALAVSWTGLVSIAASSGHFSPVGWFLHWTMRNAVTTQALVVERPVDLDLDDPALIRRAAGHFASDCAFCHGAPGVPQSAVTEAMTPSPPRLAEDVGGWSDRELFWIVQHGIKYSGMPAWISQERPDEVWAMAAFLRALPSLTPAAYAEMALGGAGADVPPPVGNSSTALAAIGEIARTDCARCHGRDGQGVPTPGGVPGEVVPIIAGQPEAYLAETLRAFAAGERHSGFMQSAAQRYDGVVLDTLARHYAAQPTRLPATVPTGAPQRSGLADKDAPAPAGSAVARTRAALARVVPEASAYGAPYDQSGLADLGRRLASEGLPERKLPACDSCHGGSSASSPVGRSLYPYLAGQPAWYLSTHLKLWREGERGGTRKSHLMDKIAIHLTDEQIAAVSAWYERQPAGFPASGK